MKIIKGLFFIALIFCTSLANALTPQEFVNKTTDRVMEIIQSSASDSLKSEQLTNTFVETMDIQWIAKFVLGRSFLTLTDQEKALYFSTYKSFLINAYVPLFKKYNGQAVLIKLVQPLDNKNYTVLTEITYQDKTINVEYRIAAEEQTYRIRDIIAEGVSLLQTQRSDFSSVLANSGFKSLIAQLNSKSQP